MYKITLANGTEIGNLELNGNNYISPTAVDSAVFDGNMETVTIADVDSGDTRQITDGVLLSNIVRGGRSWLVIGQKSAEQKQQEAVDAAVTDLQLALAEVYELMIGGGSDG